jgi:hypothetical protein
MANKHSPVIRISPPEFQFYRKSSMPRQSISTVLTFCRSAVRQGAGFTARLHVKNLIENSVAFKVSYD